MKPLLNWHFEAAAAPMHRNYTPTLMAPTTADLGGLIKELVELGYYQIRLTHKSWDKWAWPGGYPIFYGCRDGGVLCPDCANLEIEQTSDPEQIDPQWEITITDINWEDDHLHCDNCNKRIPPAYDADDNKLSTSTSTVDKPACLT